MAEDEKPVVWSTNGSHEQKSSNDDRSLPYSQVKRLLIITIITSLLAGGIGAYGYVRFLASSIPAVKQEVQVQESSATIDVAKKVSPSVVSITSRSVGQGFFGQPIAEQGAGTGIIVSSDGLIMTNKHVVSDPGANYIVITSAGKEYANAQVVARDPVNDIAFVRISASGLPAAIMGDSSAVQIGQKVVAIGNALGQFQNTVTEGVISGVGRPVTASDSSTGANAETLTNLFQTDAAINPGNSGGPLLNLDGQVIGINTAVAGRNAQNIGFAIPVNEAKPLIASVKSKGTIVRPYLGVRYVPLTNEIAAANNLKATVGAWLQGTEQNPTVLPDSPAAKGGLKEGDIVTKVNNDSITATTSLQALVAKHNVGDKVTLTVVRDGKTQKITVTLGSAPAN